MPQLPRLVTMTARVSTTPPRGGNRTGPKIPQLANPLQKRPTFGFQGWQGIRHEYLLMPSVSYTRGFRTPKSQTPYPLTVISRTLSPRAY